MTWRMAGAPKVPNIWQAMGGPWSCWGCNGTREDQESLEISYGKWPGENLFL